MMLSAEDVRLALEHADVHMRAIILLGINCALGNADRGRLVVQSLTLDAGWVDYARPKTGVPHRVPLWPETMAAVRESISKRKLPKSAEHTPTVFITKRGESWYKPESRANPLSAGIWGFPFGPPAADLQESTAQRTADDGSGSSEKVRRTATANRSRLLPRRTANPCLAAIWTQRLSGVAAVITTAAHRPRDSNGRSG
jgi:integrase